jgi:hypothetical protein
MTEASPAARATVARWVAVTLLVLLALFAAPAQAAHADGAVSGVTKDQAGTPVSVTVFLFTSPGNVWSGATTSDSSTGAFSFTGVPDGDYTLTTATNSGFVGTSTAVTVAGGANVGTLSLYRFGTVSGTILNFSAVHDTLVIWVDQWTGSGWSTVSSVTSVVPPGPDGYAYTAGNAIPGPGYYRVTFEPGPGDTFLRTYSGDHAETFPGDDPSIVSIVGVFQATAYEQSFTGIDVTLALPTPPPGGGTGGGSSSGGGGAGTAPVGGGGTPTGGGVANVSSAPDLAPTAEPTPTPVPQPTTQPQPTTPPHPTSEPEPTTAADPASDPGGAPVDLWLFGVLAVVVLLGAGGLGWLVFRRR